MNTKQNNMSVCTRRTKDCYLLSVPPLVNLVLIHSFFDRSYKYAASTLWNMLSQDTEMLDEIVQFEGRMKTDCT